MRGHITESRDKGILWASKHPRRELYVGLPTLRAILAEKLAPSLADWYLARRGYKAQQTTVPEDPGRPNNLLKPVSGDFGTHGTFDSVARERSIQLVLIEKRRWAVLGLAAIGMLIWNWLEIKRTRPEYLLRLGDEPTEGGRAAIDHALAHSDSQKAIEDSHGTQAALL